MYVCVCVCVHHAMHDDHAYMDWEIDMTVIYFLFNIDYFLLMYVLISNKDDICILF